MALYLKLELKGDHWDFTERSILYRIINNTGLATVDHDDQPYHAQSDIHEHIGELFFIVPDKVDEEELLFIIREIKIYCDAEFDYSISSYPYNKTLKDLAERHEEKKAHQKHGT